MSVAAKPETEVTDKSNVREAVPFFGVSDMAASLKFYVAGLGFEVALKWGPDGQIRWCRLQLGGAGLMLQDFRREDGSVRPPEGKLGVGVNICFQCQDALAIYRQAVARGLRPKEPFVGNGLWVTGLTDPDGYHMEFASPTDVPEETTLAQWEERTKGGKS
jgi:lactoylglutathione lyase